MLGRPSASHETTKTQNHERDILSCSWFPVFVGFVMLTAIVSSGCASHHTTTGLVVRVDKPSSIVTISHDAFPGYMNAMVMPFDVKGAAKSVALAPGDRVRFRLAVKRDRSWVDRLEVLSAAAEDAGLQATPAVPVLVPVGAVIPDFELI